MKSFKEQSGSEEVTAVQEELWDYDSQVDSEPWSDRRACKEHGLVIRACCREVLFSKILVFWCLFMFKIGLKNLGSIFKNSS